MVDGKQPQEACNKLVDLTLDRGATDNVTAVVVRCFDNRMSSPQDDPFALPEGNI